MSKQPQILFICGSPRAHTSMELLALIEQGAKEAGANVERFMLSEKKIAPCTGCESCSKDGACVLAERAANGKSGGKSGGKPPDNYVELLELLAHADALAIVAPLYFAGPPAQLKALFDRMQPFWAKRYILGQKPAPKRPAQLFILGGGGDAHGHEPLVTIAKSALAVAGFSIEKVQNFMGFRAATDAQQLPTEDDATKMAFGELAHLRKAVAIQKEFEQRAIAAGSAFARFALKSAEKLELQAELKQIEAEIAEFKEPEPPFDIAGITSLQSEINSEFVEAEFEALRNNILSSPRVGTSSEASASSTSGELQSDADLISGKSAISDEQNAENQL